jgi:sulfite dehydrogenase
MSPAVVESLLVLAFVGLLILGAGALMGYVIVNHEPRAQAAATGPEKPAVGGGRIAGAGSSTTTAAATTTAPTTTSAQAGGASDLAAGKKVFASAGCGACHTLKDAGASGTIGPNLDDLKPDAERVSKQVINGGGGMPAFKDRLSPKQIEAVSKYVAAVAGKS